MGSVALKLAESDPAKRSRQAADLRSAPGESLKEARLPDLTGAQILIESLIRENVEVIFGYPGGSVLPIYDSLFDAPIRHVLTRHEQAAAHAADGYARATGRPGVCLATSGPGATNLVTGIATAYMDSVPLVAITGQVATSLVGTDAFQEADITGITMPVTKHNFLVKDVRDLARTIKEAFHIATTGRPGPVLIDLPKDVTLARVGFVYPESVNLPGYKPKFNGHPRQIGDAAAAMAEARKPVLYVGGGVIAAGAHEELRKLAERQNIPVTTTLMGLGAFPGDHPLSLGMLGMHGTAYANYSVTECDLLIAVGVRFDDRVTGLISSFAPRARIIHIDVDPAEIGKNVRVDIPIVGDARQVMEVLNEELEKAAGAKAANAANASAGPRPEEGTAGRRELEAWHEQIRQWKESHPLGYNGPGRLKPQYVVEQIYELTGGDAIITTEVGQNQMWAAQFYKFKRPRQFISSGGLGTMGYGFPAAIGAQFGHPDQLVIDIAGDGSIQMNIQELATAVVNRLPIKVAILNNNFLGMVRQWQEIFHDRRYSSVCLQGGNPDFVKLAEAYGAVGLRATSPEEVRPVLEAALKTDGPVLMDFVIAREEGVYPMVLPNSSIDRMIGVIGGGPG